MSATKTQRRSAQWSGNWSLLKDAELISAVITERKTTAAAARLGISQSAVSRGVAKIEARLGKQLFHRDSGRLIPNADALMLYRKSSSVFEALAALEGHVEAVAEQLVIVAPPTLSHFYLAREIAKFAKAFPEIMVSLDVVTIEELPAWLAEGRGDVGVTDTMFLHSGVTMEPFIETNGICVLHEAHPLTKKEIITPQDLHQVDYVGIKRLHSLRGAVDLLFNECGVQPNVTIETSGAILALEMIQEGLGVSILNPFPIVLRDHPGVAYRRFDAKLPFKTRFLTASSSTPSVSARLFLDFMRGRKAATLKELESVGAI